MSQNGLRNSERANDQDEDDVHEKKTTQLFFGIEQRITQQQPRQEEIDAIAPAIEHGHYKGRTDEDQRDVREPFHIAGDDVIRGLVNGDHKQGYESKKGKRSAELIPRHRSRRKIHGTRSEIRT